MPPPASIDRTLATIRAAYRAGEAERGVRLARAALADDAGHGQLRYALACCLERAGDLRTADHWFAEAARAGVEPQAAPFRVSWPRFRRAVDAAGEALPPALRSALADVTLVMADYAEPVLIDGYDDEWELLGLFTGQPRDQAEPAPGDLSPHIHLWRRAHEHACRNAKEFDAEVRQTLWHELGHYLGYDEDELEELGRG